MKLLIDMNLSPRWVDFLEVRGVEAVHWSTVGNIRAKDSAIMSFAREHGYVVFTHDMDFSTLLATTGAAGPSVIQVRAQDVLPTAIGDDVVRVLGAHVDALKRGAIITVDEAKARVRILPLRRSASTD